MLLQELFGWWKIDPLLKLLLKLFLFTEKLKHYSYIISLHYSECFFTLFLTLDASIAILEIIMFINIFIRGINTTTHTVVRLFLILLGQFGKFIRSGFGKYTRSGFGIYTRSGFGKYTRSGFGKHIVSNRPRWIWPKPYSFL